MSEKAPCPNCGELLIPGTFCPKDGAKVPAILDFATGAMVGKYVLEAKIGEGGMGEVWRGKNPEINKRVAIKILNPQLLANAQAISRFKREALAVNEIRHKNLVDIFDIGEMRDGRPYFVMEYLEGEPLDEYMKRKVMLPFAEIQTFLQPICKALAATHQRNIIHRDLKPENIFLVKEEDDAPPTVKLLDFGIAKLSISEDSKHNATRTGSVIGTPAYMSPEQCEGARAVDHRSDLYSLGIILFEMITGRTPFQEPGEGTGMVLAKHITMPVPKPSSVVVGRKLGPEVDAFLMKVLSKVPSERPQSALDFYQDFIKAAQSQSEESIEQVKDAKPVFGKKITQNPASKGPSPIQIALPQEEAPSHTGDYYAGDSGTLRPIKHKRSNLPVILGASLSILVGISAAAFFVLSESETPQKTQPLAQTPVIPVTATAPVSLASVEPKPAVTPTPTPNKPASVLLIITSEISATEISLDGKSLGRVPINQSIPYEDKELTLLINAEGYEPKEMKIRPTDNIVEMISKQKLTKIVKAPVIKNNTKIIKTNKPKTCFTPEGLAYQCP